MNAVTNRRLSPGLLLGLVLAVVAPQVFAHTGTMATPVTLVDAFLHPFTGVDHLAALLAAGLWSAQQTGRSRYGLPLVFLFVMAGAALYAGTGMTWSMAETAITLSLVALALALLARRAVSGVVASALAVMCASGHGYAHGAEMLRDGYGLPLAVALLAASALIVIAGFAVGSQLRQAGNRRSLDAIGIVLAAAGGLLLGA